MVAQKNARNLRTNFSETTEQLARLMHEDLSMAQMAPDCQGHMNQWNLKWNLLRGQKSRIYRPLLSIKSA